MADNPARRGFGSPEDGPDQGDPGWGSPMPAEYGSLAAFLPPVSDPWGTPVVREAADSPPDAPARSGAERLGAGRSGRLARRLRQAVNPAPPTRPAVRPTGIAVPPEDVGATRASEYSTSVEDVAPAPDTGDWGSSVQDRAVPDPGVAAPAPRPDPAADPGAPFAAEADRGSLPQPRLAGEPTDDAGMRSEPAPAAAFDLDADHGGPVGSEPDLDPGRSRGPGRRERSGGYGGAGSMGAYGVEPVMQRDDDAAGAWSEEGQENHVFDRGGDEYEPGLGGASYSPGSGAGSGGVTPLGMAAVPAGMEGRPASPLTPVAGTGHLSRRQRRRQRRWVESRWIIRHLDIWTVIKVSVVFYLIVLAAVVVASVLLWYLADSFGALHTIEKSVKSLFDLKTFTLHPKAVAMWTAAGGAALAVGGTIANVLAALVYNLISDLVGGISARVVTEAE